jgi:hypothetical protein
MEGDFGGGPAPLSAAGLARKDAREAEEAAEVLRVALEGVQDATVAVESYKIETERLAKAQQEASAALKKVTDQVDSRAAEVERDRAVLGINRDAASKVQDIQTSAELSRAGFKPGSKLGRTLLGNIEAEEARAHGETMTSAQAQGIQSLVSVLRQTGHNQNQINKIIADMMDVTKSHEDKLRELASEIGQLRQQQRGQAYP